jgi:D-alanyl-D-alanine carboxypeptidase (penicillin-binding protein 5/6)
MDETTISRILLCGITGCTLLSENAERPHNPASLAKMMTLYLLFEALRARTAHIDDRIVVSEAAGRPRGKGEHALGLIAGETVPLHVLIPGIAVVSANDAALAVAEHLAGRAGTFVRRMNEKCQAFGMTSTVFRTPSGTYRTGQTTTARNMAALAFRLYSDFPEYRPWFQMASYSFRGIRQRATNGLVGKYPGMTGIKTGTVPGTAVHLAASAERNGTHLISVVMGCPTYAARREATLSLLDWGFERAPGTLA